MGKYNITRGEKWTKVREKAVFEEDQNTVDWLDSQSSIVADIKEYQDSIPEEKSTKSKGKK